MLRQMQIPLARGNTMKTARASPTSSSDPSKPPKKKMRQGTHSCIECRRRKIKCKFQDDRPNVCNECFTRGIQCIDQESAADYQTEETRQSLRERVAHLESIVKTVVQKIELEDRSSTGSTDGDESTKSKAISEVPDLVTAAVGSQHAPIMTLFNNNFVSGHAEEDASPGVSEPLPRNNLSATEEKIRQKLLAAVPSDKDIEAILRLAAPWCAIFERLCPEIFLVENGVTLLDFILEAIKSGPFLKLCKALLLLCLTLQQITFSEAKAYLKLSRRHDELIHFFISTIEGEVLSNDHFCVRLEALDCMLMLTKLDTNAGRPRKAWLTCRRALSFALLLGLHRRAKWVDTPADPKGGTRRRMTFVALFHSDRYISLLLGLPYSITDQQCDVEVLHGSPSTSEVPGVTEKLMLSLGNVAGRLVDRCQDPELVSLESTMKYEQELEDLAKSLPPLTPPSDCSDPDQVFGEVYGHNAIRFFHHWLRSMLHLPFMLKAGTDHRYEFSRLAALESARQMINAYCDLRTYMRSGFAACKTVDFQVLTACVMLAINKQGLSRFPRPGNLSRQDRDSRLADEEQDMQLIRKVKSIYESISPESATMRPRGGENVQDQAARVLGLFLECDEQLCNSSCGGVSAANKTSIDIPYFGTITIRPGKAWEGFERERHAANVGASSVSAPARSGSNGGSGSQKRRRAGGPSQIGTLSPAPSVSSASSTAATSPEQQQQSHWTSSQQHPLPTPPLGSVSGSTVDDSASSVSAFTPPAQQQQQHLRQSHSQQQQHHHHQQQQQQQFQFNPCIAFDPFNLPIPGGHFGGGGSGGSGSNGNDLSASGLVESSASPSSIRMSAPASSTTTAAAPPDPSTYFDPLLPTALPSWPDGGGAGTDLDMLSGADLDFELDNGWNWIINGKA